MTKKTEPRIAPAGRFEQSRFAQGARAAAAIASDYDATTTHDHRLGDCILGKMNLRSVPPRRNRRRVEDPGSAFVRGLAAGVAEMHRQLIADGDSAGVRSVIRAAGLTLDRMRAAGVSPIDLRRLRRAGVR